MFDAFDSDKMSARTILACFASGVSMGVHARAAARMLPPVQIVDLVVPEAGSLDPITGRVLNLPADAQGYKMCVYLQSRSNTFNGPKPCEQTEREGAILA